VPGAVPTSLPVRPVRREYRRTMGEQGGRSRRQVIVGLGRGGLAVAVLGAAGCSDGRSGTSTPSTPATGPGTPATGTGTPATGTGTPATGTGTPATGALAWERVDLGFVSAYVLVRGREAAVVDTGVGGSADEIGRVLDAAGPGWAGVRHVVLTHHHGDHAGSIGDVLTRAPDATGYIGEADRPRVTSPRPLRPVADGTQVFGLQVVATPGHTDGHVSVFDPDSGVLVTGDALTNDGGLSGSNPQFTADSRAAAESVRKLAALPVRTLLFGHGEPLGTDAAAALRRLAAG